MRAPPSKLGRAPSLAAPPPLPQPPGRRHGSPRAAFAEHLAAPAPRATGARAGGGRPPEARDASPQRHPARPRHHDEALDPLARQAAQLAPPAGGAPLPPPQPGTPAAAAEVRGRASLEDLLPVLVRKVAWSGDGRRGAVRLEVGAGALAGATLVVEAHDGRVRVHLSAPPGIDLDGWRGRIARRLAARGLDLDEVD